MSSILQNKRARAGLIYGGTALAVLLILFVLLPGSGGGGRGTPLAIVFQGLVQGMVASLTAVGIVLIYRTIRIINFAQGALGIAGGVLAFRLVQFTPTPFPVAMLLGMAVAGAVGVLVGLAAIRFQRAPRLVLTVLTILLTNVLGFFTGFVDNLPFFPPQEFRPIGQGGDEAIRQGIPFGGFEFTIGDLQIPFGFAEILAIEVSLAALVLIAALFRYTRLGVAVRGVSENAERASLLGLSVGKLATMVWGLTAALSGVAVILTGTVGSPGSVTSGVAPTLLIPALAGAVIARMRSLPIAATATAVIFVLEAAWKWSFRDDAPLFSIALLLTIGIGLFLQRNQLMRSEAATETSSWVASQEQRPIPRVLLRVPGIRITRVALIVIGAAAVLVYPFMVGTGATNLGGVVAIQTIVIISLVLLTGWAGQVSLGQYALTGVGAVVGGALTNRIGIPFWFAVPLTAVIVGAIAVVVGLPALRIRGLFLLVVTFAFAFAVQQAFFSERYFGWLQPERVDRPTFFFLDFEDERSMYYLCVAALILVIFMVSSLRRTRIGRVLIAVRDNEPNLRAFGVGPVRAKLMAFAIAGALAGFAGAIFAHQQRGISAESFTADASITTFIAAVFGGIGSVGGALLGAFYFNFLDYLVTNEILRGLLGPVGALGLLYAAPGGVISLVTRMRDSVLSIVAQRRQLNVPGMREDIDVSSGIWPLAEPLPRSGLAALPPGSRFTVESDLYAELAEAAPSTSRDIREAVVFGDLEDESEELDHLAFAPTSGNGQPHAVGSGRR